MSFTQQSQVKFNNNKNTYNSLIVENTAKWIEQSGKGVKQSFDQIQAKPTNQIQKSPTENKTIPKTSKYNAKKMKLKTMGREKLPKEGRSLWKRARKSGREK